mgnify:CR=1 FL=1
MRGETLERAFLSAATGVQSLLELDELRGNRVYLGSEFCERLLPAKDGFIGALKLAENLNIKVTLLTPPFSEKGIKLFEGFIREIAKPGEFDFEVVFNDWGVIEILENFPRFERIMGRVIASHYDNSYYADVAGFPGVFLEFLKEKQIHAVEFNSVRQFLGARDQLAGCNIRTHLYYPFAYLKVTRFCESVKTSGRYSRDAIGFCAKECMNVRGGIRHERVKTNFLARGNAWFSRIEDNLDAPGLKPDRIVYNNLYFDERIPVPSKLC